MRHRLFVAAIVLTSSLASAESDRAPRQAAAAPTTSKTVALVNERLVQPLAEKEESRSKFSRARLPPSERRVRMLDEKPRQDTGGDAFYTFAIDARHGWGEAKEDANWSKATITGCVYPDRGEVFIKRGNAFHPAAAAIGKKTKAAPESTCQAAPQLSKL
jgi:hypothetical protein